MMTPDQLRRDAARLIEQLEERGLKIATAESCTGGLVAAMLTEVPGSSRAVERGFVTYTNTAKVEMLGIEQMLIDRGGAVSSEVAVAMAEGALRHSHAHVTVAVTGIAGPDGGTAEKPVGLVHIAAACRERPTLHEECRFGAIGRDQVRYAAAAAAFALVRRAAGL